MIPPKCEQELSLPCYFFDVNKNLRPASFFDVAQEIAVQGSAMVGAPDWVLKDRDIAWILSRMHVRFEQYPRLYDKVLLQTWHRRSPSRGLPWWARPTGCSRTGT